MASKKSNTSSFSAKLINGGIAGSIGTCCVFPLDLAKTRIQDQRTFSKTTGQAATRLYKNVFHCMYIVGKTEGVRGLYKGLGINLFLVNPEKAIKLAVNDQCRQHLGSKQGSMLPLRYEAMAGGLAGMCQIFITTPMEFLKIQMQVAGRNAESAQTSAVKVAVNLMRQRGIAGIYKGTGATFIRDVPFSCVYFPLFSYLNSLGYKDGRKPHPVHSLASGLGSGVFSAVLVTPMDVIKTRLQVLKRMEGEPSYNGWSDAVSKIYRNEGLSAFFKGAITRAIVVAPLFGIAQMVYFVGFAETIMERASQQRIKDFS
ncbi:mitochondrial glutamate carrier 1-like isoform X1 [Clytia hemisphaerica]|uniref:Uncharacterized protein n=1 Tax=Clytia hemisphaerica TaxID=252671 RepID=A0A7M5V5Q5_9CNID